MRTATSVAELDRAPADLSEKERLDLLDDFVLAVSSGWPRVMSFLDSCELDRAAREILKELQDETGDTEEA